MWIRKVKLWEPSILFLVFPPSLEAQSPSRRTSAPPACTSSPCSRPPEKFQLFERGCACSEYPFVVAGVSWDSIALQLEPGLHQVEGVHQQNLDTSWNIARLALIVRSHRLSSIRVLNRQNCNQCLKCHKSPGLSLLLSLSWSLSLSFELSGLVSSSLCHCLSDICSKTILETCDIWDTDYNPDNWEPEFMTIFVIWQLRVTLDSIRNSCDVF